MSFKGGAPSIRQERAPVKRVNVLVTGFPWTHVPEGVWDVELIDGIERVLWDYRNEGFLVILADQLLFDPPDPQLVASYLNILYSKFMNNPIVDSLVNAMGPASFGLASLRTKPNYGLLVEVESHLMKQKLAVDWEYSLVFALTQDDIDMAARAGVNTVTLENALAMKKAN